jgi:DNA-binding transcriptional regulator YhcF (GntR family)
MRIHINKQSEVPVREQLREQIIYLLGTGKLPVGSTLPSVRELGRQLKVHYNTVSHVYADLVREGVVGEPAWQLIGQSHAMHQSGKSRI